jgi:hypothetical protein
MASLLLVEAIRFDWRRLADCLTYNGFCCIASLRYTLSLAISFLRLMVRYDDYTTLGVSTVRFLAFSPTVDVSVERSSNCGFQLSSYLRLAISTPELA